MISRRRHVLLGLDVFVATCGLAAILYGIFLARQAVRDVAVGGALMLLAGASFARGRRGASRSHIARPGRTAFLRTGLIFIVGGVYSTAGAIYCDRHYESLPYRVGGVVSFGVGAVLAYLLAGAVLRYWWQLGREGAG